MNKKMKIYKKPILKKYGNLKSITKGGGGQYSDAGHPYSQVIS